MATRRKPGRKPMPKGHVRSSLLGVRLTEREYAAIRKAARPRDAATWARDLLLAAVGWKHPR
ncbi:MAG TPA: hypothetical protein VFV19_14745 [Candidatus Polarisedimenticolaceae bacterium]|nr:hypothetical protein [Candidatus Polarisedimenticolaceae bacterium]